MDDATAKSLEYIGNRMADMEAQMIDPIEFGQLREAVAGQRRDLDQMAKTLSQMAESMKQMERTLTEARGGWKVLMAVGGAIGVVISALVWGAQWIADHIV